MLEALVPACPGRLWQCAELLWFWVSSCSGSALGESTVSYLSASPDTTYILYSGAEIKYPPQLAALAVPLRPSLASALLAPAQSRTWAPEMAAVPLEGPGEGMHLTQTSAVCSSRHFFVSVGRTARGFMSIAAGGLRPLLGQPALGFSPTTLRLLNCDRRRQEEQRAAGKCRPPLIYSYAKNK